MYKIDCIIAISNELKWLSFTDSIKCVLMNHINNPKLFYSDDIVLAIEGSDINRIYRATLYDDYLSLSGSINEIVLVAIEIRENLNDNINIFLFDKDNNYSIEVATDTTYEEVIRAFPPE